ncbi:uncharacterized protein METZ01_LOCUS444280, partial [marine metagenome]
MGNNNYMVSVAADIKEEVKLEDVIKEIVGTEWHDGHEPQGIDDQYVEE